MCWPSPISNETAPHDPTLPGDELGLPDGSLSMQFRSPRPQRDAAGAARPQSTSSSGTSTGGAAASAGAGAPGVAPPPPPVILDKEEFDAYVSGGRFVEWHPDLFAHPLAAHRTGYTLEDVRAVIREGEAPKGGQWVGGVGWH